MLQKKHKTKALRAKNLKHIALYLHKYYFIYEHMLTLSVLTNAALSGREVIIILSRRREGGIGAGEFGEGGFKVFILYSA
jgi:hypothetical protein